MKEVTCQQDNEWLLSIQKGDEQALASLMRKYYSDLYNYGTRFTQDDSLVKDAIQEVFISLWQRRQSVGVILSPKFYLLRAIKNKVLKSLDSAYRKNLQGRPEEYDFFHEFPVEKIIIMQQSSDEKAERLKRIIALLSKREKEVVYLKYYQYLDNGQIAELMNIGRQSVYNLLHDAIRKLKELWHKEFIHQ
ncbi:MAG: sigma-70 family RNA polymerase sigma factor [Chitinophagaceae bacterium]